MEKHHYKIIREFICYGKRMVTVRIGKCVHVMDYNEWQLIYGRNHQNRWEIKVDWKSFTPEEGYKTMVP